MTRHFLSVSDLTREELIGILDRAAELKALRGSATKEAASFSSLTLRLA